jgi:uncharacterized membrane protein HdeD (DUF308 family)
LVIAGYSIWAVYELIPLFKQKIWRDFWLDIVMGLLSLSLFLLLCFNVKLPSPEKPIREIVISIFGK